MFYMTVTNLREDVPQGLSVIALLFCIYINDLIQTVNVPLIKF